MFYSPKKVAEAIGVSEASLKRWCDKGLLKTSKTAGGHRRIQRQDALSFIRSNKHVIVKPDVLGLPGVLSQRQEFFPIDDVLAMIKSGNSAALRSYVIGLYLSQTSLHQIYDEVFAPLFHMIGKKWETGSLDIYEERFSSDISQRLLYELSSMIPSPAENAPLALGATLSGDPYSLGMLMAETVLRDIGWRTRTVGINLPAESLVRGIQNCFPKIMWLSVSHIQNLDLFYKEFQLIWEGCKEHNVVLVVGGRCLTSDIRSNISYHCFCDSMRDLHNFLQGLH